MEEIAMRMSPHGKLLMLVGLAGMMAGPDIIPHESGGMGRKRKVSKPKPTPHRGQKEYHFNMYGVIISNSYPGAAFTCFAINDKNALKKYYKWKDTQK